MNELTSDRAAPAAPRLRLFQSDAEPGDNPGMAKRRRKKLPRFLRWPDAMRLLDWCTAQVPLATNKAKRYPALCDEMFVRIGLYLGLRIAEIINLDVTDVDLERRTVLVRNGKGGRDRMVRIAEKLAPHLKAWIGDRKEGVLIERYGKRLAKRTMRTRLDLAAKGAGLTVHVHPHILRHSHATRFLETGGNIRSLQALLGHASLSTTAVYLDLDVSRFAADVDRL